MLKLTTIQKQELALKLGADSVGWSSKAAAYVVKRGYFYSHGFSEAKLAEAVRLAIPGAVILEATNHFNCWPRDSWFEVRFQFPEAK